MMSDREKKVFAVVLVLCVVAGYFSFAWAGYVPEKYNIIEQYLGTGDGGNTTGITQEVTEPSLTLFQGIPTSVNLTEVGYEVSYVINVVAKEGYCNRFMIRLDAQVSGVNVTLSQADYNGNQRDLHWVFSENGDTAYYLYPYDDLRPFESTRVKLTISGDASSKQGWVYVYCTSNGFVQQNEGVFPVYL